MFDFNEIIRKFNYDKKLSLFLHQIYKQLVAYYGNEEIIYNAFLSTEIKSTNNIYDYLKQNDMLEEDTIVTEKDLKRSVGIYTSKPVITFEEGMYKLTDVKRVVLIKNLFLTDDKIKATLIHEICHMVKSYENEYIIRDNKLANNSGIITRYYRLDIKDGIIEKTLLREKGVGLEEGFTTLTEEFITRAIVDENYCQIGYGPVYTLARELTNYINESLIKYAEIHHDRDVLYQYINNYDTIEEISDIVYKLNLEMYDKAFEPKELEKIKNKIIFLINRRFKQALEDEDKKGKIR